MGRPEAEETGVGAATEDDAASADPSVESIAELESAEPVPTLEGTGTSGLASASEPSSTAAGDAALGSGTSDVENFP